MFLRFIVVWAALIATPTHADGLRNHFQHMGYAPYCEGQGQIAIQALTYEATNTQVIRPIGFPGNDVVLREKNQGTINRISFRFGLPVNPCIEWDVQLSHVSGMIEGQAAWTNYRFGGQIADDSLHRLGLGFATALWSNPNHTLSVGLDLSAGISTGVTDPGYVGTANATWTWHPENRGFGAFGRIEQGWWRHSTSEGQLLFGTVQQTVATVGGSFRLGPGEQAPVLDLGLQYTDGLGTGWGQFASVTLYREHNLSVTLAGRWQDLKYRQGLPTNPFVTTHANGKRNEVSIIASWTLGKRK